MMISTVTMAMLMLTTQRKLSLLVEICLQWVFMCIGLCTEVCVCALAVMPAGWKNELKRNAAATADNASMVGWLVG